MDKEIVVSIYCLAYNHEKYIRDALEGFVRQKTNFVYEVIVHDDASTDATADIIREYEIKYPEIIKPIYQTENQYSQGIDNFVQFIFPRIRGKYIAICEGDDFWTDDNKLQKQVDFLEAHEDFSACTHNTIYQNMETKTKKINFPKEDSVIGFDDVIMFGGAAYHTSSLMYRKKLADAPPAFVRSVKGVGDYPLAIYLALSGKIMRFGDVMSHYRLGVPGSFTKRMNMNHEKNIRIYSSLIKMLEQVDVYTNKKYSKTIDERIFFNRYMISYLRGDYYDVTKGKYSALYKKETLVNKIAFFIRVKIPWLAKFLNKLRGYDGK